MLIDRVRGASSPRANIPAARSRRKMRGDSMNETVQLPANLRGVFFDFVWDTPLVWALSTLARRFLSHHWTGSWT